MKKILAGVAAVFMLSGCGNLCDRFEASSKSITEKAKPCNMGGSTTIPFDRAQCDAKLKVCTADDQAKMNKFLDCLDKVGTCVAGQEEAWGNSVVACAAQMEGISAACAE